MTMNFRNIAASLTTILGNAEAGRYQTIGFQRQVTSADESLNILRMVQVYYSSGEFSTQGSPVNGPTQHDATYNIDLRVASPATADLSVINNPVSTPAEIAAAIASMAESAQIANESIDELMDIIYQVIMDARNYDLGQSIGTVANRFIHGTQKDQPVPQGEYVVLTGSIQFRVRTYEEVLGDTGTAGGIYDTTIDIDGDDVEKTGILVNNT